MLVKINVEKFYKNKYVSSIPYRRLDKHMDKCGLILKRFNISTVQGNFGNEFLTQAEAEDSDKFLDAQHEAKDLKDAEFFAELLLNSIVLRYLPKV